VSLYRYIIILSLLHCLQDHCLGQYGTFEQLSTAHGLSQSNVTCIAQDVQGYIWIGTDAGLNRYDGYEFKVYEYEDRDPYSLPSSAIRCLFVSSDDVLWIGTFGGGLARYSAEIDGFIRYQNIAGDVTTIADNEILAISEDQHQNIWIGTEAGGLNRLSFTIGLEHPVITRFSADDPAGISHNYVHALCSATNGDLIIGTWGGINILNSADLESSPSNVNFNRISADEDSGTSLSSNAVRTIIQDNGSDQYWVGTWGGGLNHLVCQDGHYTVSQRLPRALEDLSDRRYTATLHKDPEGKIWIGSFDEGLTIYNPHESTAIPVILSLRSSPTDQALSG